MPTIATDDPLSSLPATESPAPPPPPSQDGPQLPPSDPTPSRDDRPSHTLRPAAASRSTSAMSDATAAPNTPSRTSSSPAVRPSSPSSADDAETTATLLRRALVPNVAVLSSPDCEELMRHKGVHGGLLELLRPFGERVPGRVVIRDSTGASRPWDDFGVRFIGMQDGMRPARTSKARTASDASAADGGGGAGEYRPARLRSGGDVGQIEQLIERSLDAFEGDGDDDDAAPPLFELYQKKLLCGTVLSPHETFAHPVALVIAISSRNASPIEELRSLYAASNTGELRLPPHVNNEFMRYYVLIHDEDYDDIKKSTALFEQMKRHFGLHCHLLRLRSIPCAAADQGAVGLDELEWTSAAEDLALLAAQEDPVAAGADSPPVVFESDATAIRSFVREMVTQSIIPSMERSTATWNDQVASRRRGISGRFMSLSKRFTPFGGRAASSATSSSSAAAASGSNYDSAGGFYRPDSPEALLRKLADYAAMLRDYRLAQQTYEMLCGDFKGDRAWLYYAGASEMLAVTSMLLGGRRADVLEQYLENAYYSYFARCGSGFYAQRTVLLAAELLRAPAAPDPVPSSSGAAAAAAKWYERLLDDRAVDPVAHAVLSERIAECYAAATAAAAVTGEQVPGSGSVALPGHRRRKAAFYSALASAGWRDMLRPRQAARCAARAARLYSALEFGAAAAWLAELSGGGDKGLEQLLGGSGAEDDVLLEVVEVGPRGHRRAGSIAAVGDPLGAMGAGGEGDGFSLA